MSDRKSEALRLFSEGASSPEISVHLGIPEGTIRRWASEEGVRKGNSSPLQDNTPALTRRCRNMRCTNRFVPVNTQNFYCSPECRLAPEDEQHSTEAILEEEGALIPEESLLELAKRAFGQKNQALRKYLDAVSLRQYLAHELRSISEEDPRLLYPPPPGPGPSPGDDSPREVVLVCSDWQFGKLEQGIGIEVMQEQRIPRVMEATRSIVRRQINAGHPVHRVHLVLVGDLVEGCWIYAGQNVTGLDRTDNTHRITKQAYLVANTIADIAWDMAGYAEEVVVHSVPGNHGRPNGKNEYADPEDNFDTMCAMWARDKLANAANVKWDIEERWWGNVNILGHQFVTMHGDAWRGPTEQLDKLLPSWVLSNTFGGIPSAVILGHRHEFNFRDINGVTVIQNGTIDGGSEWFLKLKGRAARPEQTVLVVSEKRSIEAVYPVYFET